VALGVGVAVAVAVVAGVGFRFLWFGRWCASAGAASTASDKAPTINSVISGAHRRRIKNSPESESGQIQGESASSQT